MTVVGLGAWCDYVTEDEERERHTRMLPSPVEAREPGWAPFPINQKDINAAVERLQRQLSFRVQEFAELDDGRRITLHEERGFSEMMVTVGGPAPTLTEHWDSLTVESVAANVLSTVLPDDDDGEEHPWEWLVELLHDQGIEASTEELKRVPYRVELSERLHAKLQEQNLRLREELLDNLGHGPTSRGHPE